jgi:uncharacterized phosphosugar-binding protein
MTAPALSGASAYLAGIADRIAALAATQGAAIGAAAEACVETIRRDGLIYIFGTGHSHLMAEEGHFRAGGLACVVPILASSVMLHEGAVVSGVLERMTGLADPLLSRYPIGPDDTLFVYSNSGVNAVPVEAARYGKARGARVVAVTSIAYSKAAAAGRETLAEIADIAIDNQGPPGDASVTAAEGLIVGPISTVLGAAIWNAVLTETVARLAQSGEVAPAYISSNMPGSKDRNAALVERYRTRNPHL